MILESVSLLPLNKYQEQKDKIPRALGWWWLETPVVSKNLVYAINGPDLIRLNPRSYCGVRPYCAFALEMSDAEFWIKPGALIGLTFNYKGFDWTILNAEDSKVFALCAQVVTECVFDGRSTQWAGSAVQAWLNTDFFKYLK